MSRVAIIAENVPAAKGIAARLGLDEAVPMSARTVAKAARGCTFSAAIVDQDAGPLSPEAVETLQLALAARFGEVFGLRRVSLSSPF